MSYVQYFNLFQVNVCKWYYRSSISFFCMWLSSFYNTIYWRDYLFTIECFWLYCQILVDQIWRGLFLGSFFLFLWKIATIFIFIKIKMHWLWFICSNDKIVSFEDVSDSVFRPLSFYMKPSLFNAILWSLLQRDNWIIIGRGGGFAVPAFVFIFMCFYLLCFLLFWFVIVLCLFILEVLIEMWEHLL